MSRSYSALLLLATGLALLLPSAGSTADSSRQIVVHGARGGSNLALSVREGRLVVRGRMARARPTGCHFRRDRSVAACRLGGVDSIVLDMGPSGDFIEVRDRLPVALHVYLGDGSDKFIGNGERDFCYPGGNRRNRCIGRGGDDVCITGPRNSDCVGGRGDDYCRHGTGSDGCWGGPGRDVCVMGPGHDGCHGGRGNDRLYGGSSSDRLYGGGGHDLCDGGPGWGRSQSCESGPRR
jgi:RTX calcium-binding nonapeptide repeat (4 copies)